MWYIVDKDGDCVEREYCCDLCSDFFMRYVPMTPLNGYDSEEEAMAELDICIRCDCAYEGQYRVVFVGEENL